MSEQTVKRLSLTISEALAAVGIFIASLSALTGWVILPEQVRVLRADNDKQDVRIAMIERVTQEKAEAVARIDERTMRIEKTLNRLNEVHTEK